MNWKEERDGKERIRVGRKSRKKERGGKEESKEGKDGRKHGRECKMFYF